MFDIKTFVYKAIKNYWNCMGGINYRMYKIGLIDMDTALQNVDYYADKKFKAIDKFICTN